MQKKTFVIIGAGPGLGNAIAREFASHDFRVVLIARNGERLNEYKQEFEREGIETYVKQADAAKPETLTRAIDEVTRELGTPDVLVYHVGITQPDPETITNELLMERYQVDVASAYVVSDHLARNPEFAAKKGAILYTGGGFAYSFQPILFLKPLCIDKAALNATCIVLHELLAPQGIFVGSVLIHGVIDPNDEKYAPKVIAREYWKMCQERKEWQLKY